MVWVTYDATAAFPQDAQFGRGVTRKVAGVEEHTPPVGVSSFGVPDPQLAEGLDERFYQVTAPDTLTVRPPLEVQAIRDADQAQADAKAAEQANAQAEVATGPAVPSVQALRDRVTAIEHLLGLRSDV